MSEVNIEKAIRHTQNQGTFEVYGLRDLPGRPLAGGRYLAARVYDRYTADILVDALKEDARKQIKVNPKPPCGHEGCVVQMDTVFHKADCPVMLGEALRKHADKPLPAIERLPEIKPNLSPEASMARSRKRAAKVRRAPRKGK